MRHVLRILRRAARTPLTQVILAIAAAILIAATVAYVVERPENRSQFGSLGDALWWAIVTMTTVGYGDKIPTTIAGRAVGIFIMFGGVVLISILTATVSTIFVTRKLKESQGLKQIKFKNHIVICGWNYNTEDIVRTFGSLSDRPPEIVLVNELPPERMEALLSQFKGLKVGFVHGDFTKESALELANVGNARAVVVLPDASTGIGQQADDRTLLATLTTKSLNPKVKVFAHIVNPTNLLHLKRAGADEVVVSDEMIGFFLANHILHPGAPQLVRDLLSDKHGDYVHRVPIPREFVSRTYGELLTHFKQTNNWTLIGLTYEEANLRLEDVLTHDYSAIDTFIERKFREAGIDVRDKSDVRTIINPPSDHPIKQRDHAIVIGALRRTEQERHS